MTLKDLIESTLVKDDHTIGAHIHIDGGIDFFRKGHWFQDPILDVTDLEIDTLKFMGNYWDVHLLGPMEDDT